MSRSRRTQELILVEGGVPSAAQSLILDCEDGRPSAVASVQVWPVTADDTTTAESATTGSAAVETNPNTTITAVAGPTASDPTALTLNSGTGVIPGRRYLLTDDNTQVSEWVEVEEANGTAIKLRHPLVNAYSIGATFQSTRWTIAVSSTWIADLSNLSRNDSPAMSYRVKWHVTVNGNAAVYLRGFDVVRYPASHGVIPLDVDDRHPGFLDRLMPNHQKDQGRSLIEAAYLDVVKELRGDGKADQAFRDPELVADLVIARTHLNMMLADGVRGAANDAALQDARDNWRQAYDQSVRAPIAQVDVTGGGASTATQPKWLTRR